MNRVHLRIRRILPLLCAAGIVIAQQPNRPKEEIFKGFDRYMDTMLVHWKTPGAAVAVIWKDSLIFAKGYGYRDAAKRLPVTPHTLFAIASCSKAFTTAGLGLLVSEGKLEWDKPVRDYFPGLRLFSDDLTDHVTIRDMVTHRTGISRHDMLWYSGQFSRAELIDRLRYLEPARQLRAGYLYNNLMYVTAGYVAGHLAGTTWEAFTRKRLLEPLEMTETNFSVNDSRHSGDAALPYQEIDGVVREIPYRMIDALGPAGAMNSTVIDMSHWVIMHLNGGTYGGKQVVPAQTVRDLHTPVIVSSTSVKYPELFYSMYALGWGVTSYRGHLRVSHNGVMDGFIAQVTMLPKDSIGVIVLANRNFTQLPYVVAHNLCDRMLGLDEVPWSERFLGEERKAEEEEAQAKTKGDPDRKLKTKPSHEMTAYAGTFYHPAFGEVVVAETKGALTLRYSDFSTPLSHYHYDVFETNDDALYGKYRISFLTSVRGEIDRLVMALDDEDVLFTRRGDERLTKRDFLLTLIGDYEMGSTAAQIVLKEGKTLLLTLAGRPAYELVPGHGTEFTLKDMPGTGVVFDITAGGTVTGFRLNQPDGVFLYAKKPGRLE